MLRVGRSWFQELKPASWCVGRLGKGPRMFLPVKSSGLDRFGIGLKPLKLKICNARFGPILHIFDGLSRQVVAFTIVTSVEN